MKDKQVYEGSRKACVGCDQYQTEKCPIPVALSWRTGKTEEDLTSRDIVSFCGLARQPIVSEQIEEFGEILARVKEDRGRRQETQGYGLHFGVHTDPFRTRDNP